MITLDSSLSPQDTENRISDRTFGLVMGGLLGLISVVPMAFGSPLKIKLLGVAAALAALGLVFPRILHWPKRIWFFITHKIGLVVGFILLTIIFYGVVTPVALFFKMVGRDPLRRRMDPKATSYWVPRNQSEQASMSNQF